VTAGGEVQINPPSSPVNHKSGPKSGGKGIHKVSKTSDRIAEYENKLSMLRQTMFEDDLDWKDRAETIIKMLVEDRIEILKHKEELIRHEGSDTKVFVPYIRESD
jgi:hypothetical protein